jgi:hypothetical protein
MRVRSWASSTGEIPDWWLLFYFSTVNIDPYAQCPSLDGWTILQAYESGWNPTNYYTPPAPTGLTVKYNGSTTVNVTWNPAPGAATSYTVERYVAQLNQTTDFNITPGSAGVFTDTSFPLTTPDLGGWSPTTYRIQAHYPAGDSAWSAAVPIVTFDTSEYFASAGGTNTAASLMRGPLGAPYLAIAGFPASAATVRLVGQYDAWIWDGQQWGSTVNSTNWDVPASSFTNGIFQMPASMAAGWVGYGNSASVASACFVQLLDAASNYVSTIPVLTFYYDPAPFYDGREQLKENLSFLLRSADAYEPFGFTLQGDPNAYRTGDISYGGDNYACAGLYTLDERDQGFSDPSGAIWYVMLYYAYPDSYRPFEENNLYRNFVFSPSDVDTNGNFTTGVNSWSMPENFWLQYPPTYLFQTNSFDPLLNLGDSQWTWNNLGADQNWISFIGAAFIWGNGGYGFGLLSGVTNVFGLPFTSLEACYNTGGGEQYATITAGAPLSTTLSAAVNGLYAQTAQPVLHTTGYYFCRPNDDSYWPRNGDLSPGHSAFSPVTNTTPLMIFPFGQAFRIAGYAKQQVLNGDLTKFAFLGQYFDKAYLANPDGSCSTNQTGILSEYGEFLPTEPGLVLLATKPDGTQTNNLQGYCPVNVIKLQLDVNHDSVMDLSFGGPDNTSYYSPFQFWCNNNYDRWATNKTLLFTDVEQDDQLTAACPYTPKLATPDSDYRDHYGDRVIPCTRDLEDYARLWVCGVTSNLLSALPTSVSINLSWGDVGNPSTNNPTIDLFVAADSDGGIGYLTNETTAAEQLLSPYVGRLGPGQKLELNTGLFINVPVAEHFVWCGVSNGTGALTLTIAQGSNTLAQTTAYIQIQDIKQMYERWTVGDRPNVAPTNHAYLAEEGLPPGEMPFQYGTPPATNTTYILHVHGFNMATWEKDRYAETEYKRLYWQGYQGRFGEFRWPTTLQNAAPKAFDNSENQAWLSAVGLRNLLVSLNTEYPSNVYLTAHSHGNVVAGEALRMTGTYQAVNTYVALQAAVDSHTYDPATPPRPGSFSTPDRYGQYFTNGAPGYFNLSAGAGTYVDFFNTNDWALTQLWERDQNLKPDAGYEYSSSSDSWSQETPFLNTPLLFPRDTYTIYSFCDQAHAYALGAQANVGGAFTAARQVELDSAPYSFGPQHIYHSAEFRSDNPQRWQFWNQLLVQMKIK